MIGTLDKKRGIVNVPIRREGRLTYISMDEGMAQLAIDLFEGDEAACRAWIQSCVDDLDKNTEQALRNANVGERIGQASGFSRMVQRQLISLALHRLRELRRAAQDRGARAAA
jgi:hypothetical protein